MEHFWLCLLLLAEAQGLSIYGRLGIRKIPGDAGKSVQSQQYCWSYTSEMILECATKGNSFQYPRITATNESIVFPDNLFSQMCLIFGTIRNCHESIDLGECKSSMPKIYANSKALATKFCNNEKDLESLLGCINRPSFQSMFQEPNSENLQQQGVCRMIKNKLDQILQTTQSVCGQVDYRTLVRVLVNFGQDLSFVTEELSDYSAHCVISVNQVMPDAAVAVDVSQA